MVEGRNGILIYLQRLGLRITRRRHFDDVNDRANDKSTTVLRSTYTVQSSKRLEGPEELLSSYNHPEDDSKILKWLLMDVLRCGTIR